MTGVPRMRELPSAGSDQPGVQQPESAGSLSVGKLRGLQRLAGAGDVFAMSAMDHRASMQRMINPARPDDVDHATLVTYKEDLCEALAPVSSAVLLDPLHGAAQAIAAGLLPAEVGLLVSVEATGYTEVDGARATELLPEWSVGKVRRMGADAAKLLVYYRPDDSAGAMRQRGVVRHFTQECARSDLPCLVEAVAYRREDIGEDRAAFAAGRRDIVVETARQLGALDIDILKAEFPSDVRAERDEGRHLAACQALDAASSVPWVLLSAGVTFDEFALQVRLACQAGAAGFLAGRAVWQEAFALTDRDARRRWLQTVGTDRMRRLGDIAGAYGRPWWQKWSAQPQALADVPEGWHAMYESTR